MLLLKLIKIGLYVTVIVLFGICLFVLMVILKQLNKVNFPGSATLLNWISNYLQKVELERLT